MSRQNEQMWATLLQSGLVQGPVPEAGELESPWYVKALLAFSGWLAALFLLGFIGAAFKFVIDSSGATFLIGAVMISGAYAILRLKKNEFIEHLALALSLAGQALVIWAIFRTTRNNEEVAWMLVALLQVPLALIMPNFIHRVFSSFFATIAFSIALTGMGVPYLLIGVVMLLAAWLWLNEFHYPKHMRTIRGIAYGMVLALILLKSTALFGHGTFIWRSAYNQHDLWVRPWMGELLACSAMLYVVWQLLQRGGQALSDRLTIAALLGALLLCVVSIKAQGITLGMMIMLLGFAGANRVLLGLGIVSLLFYISSYYYLLNATLLSKAQILLIVGLAMLAARWLLRRIILLEKVA